MGLLYCPRVSDTIEEDRRRHVPTAHRGVAVATAAADGR